MQRCVSSKLIRTASNRRKASSIEEGDGSAESTTKRIKIQPGRPYPKKEGGRKRGRIKGFKIVLGHNKRGRDMRKAVRYEGKILPGGNASNDESDDLEEPPSDHECSNEEVDADSSGRGSGGNLNRLEV